jgi:hypothetical protein
MTVAGCKSEPSGGDLDDTICLECQWDVDLEPCQRFQRLNHETSHIAPLWWPLQRRTFAWIDPIAPKNPAILVPISIRPKRNKERENETR